MHSYLSTALLQDPAMAAKTERLQRSLSNLRAAMEELKSRAA